MTTLATGVPLAAGDNTPVLNFLGGRVNLLKQILCPNTNTPNMVIQLDNFSPMPLQNYGLYPQIGALSIQANGHPGGTASLDGLIVTLNLFGNNPYTAQDVPYNPQSISTAAIAPGRSMDSAAISAANPPQAFSQVGIELDMSANGPDAASSSYDPLHTYRVFLSLNPGLVTWPSWAAGTAYTAGTIIAANNAIWIATTAGTSGAISPAFTSTGVYTDGPVVWTYSETYPVVFGRGIWLDSGYGGSARSTTISYGTGFASNSLFQNPDRHQRGIACQQHERRYSAGGQYADRFLRQWYSRPAEYSHVGLRQSGSALSSTTLERLQFSRKPILADPWHPVYCRRHLARPAT